MRNMNIAGPAPGLTLQLTRTRRVTRDPETRIRSGMDRTAVATVRSPHPGTPGGTVRGTPPWRTALPGYARSYEPPQRAGAIAQGARVPATAGEPAWSFPESRFSVVRWESHRRPDRV